MARSDLPTYQHVDLPDRIDNHGYRQKLHPVTRSALDAADPPPELGWPTENVPRPPAAAILGRITWTPGASCPGRDPSSRRKENRSRGSGSTVHPLRVTHPGLQPRTDPGTRNSRAVPHDLAAVAAFGDRPRPRLESSHRSGLPNVGNRPNLPPSRAGRSSSSDFPSVHGGSRGGPSAETIVRS
jgi:hypothetical protein